MPWFALIGNVGTVTLNSYEGPTVRRIGRRRLRDGVLVFSGDGRRLATTTWQHGVEVWRLFDPELPCFHAGGEIRAVRWADGGRTIVAGQRMHVRQRGALRSWSAATGLYVQQPTIWEGSTLLDLAMDPAGEIAIATFSDGNRGRTTVRLLQREGAGWHELRKLPATEVKQFCTSLAFLGSGLALLCDTEGAVVLWDTASDTFRRLPERTGVASATVDYRRWLAAAGRDDGSTIWAGGAPGCLHRFDRQRDDSYVEAEALPFGESLESMLLLPDGSLMIGGANGLLVHLARDGEHTPFVRHSARVTCMSAGTLDGETLLATGDNVGVICLWHLDGRLEREIEFEHGTVYALEFSPDGERLLSGTGDGTVRIWPVREAALIDLARRRMR
jgi:WD40 repeat protein